jgi:hypothetical protein
LLLFVQTMNKKKRREEKPLAEDLECHDFKGESE